MNHTSLTTPIGRPLYGTAPIPFSKFPADELGEYEQPLLYSYVLRDSVAPKDLVFLILPGGGYGRIALDHEGTDMAERLNQKGYDAYVLAYRLPDDQLMTDRAIVPLQDALHTLKEIGSSHADKKIVLVGFSAGGHLAACLANIRQMKPPKLDLNAIPDIDYAALLYPVISMADDITHNGSKANLIGKNAAEDVVRQYSADELVGHHTPPTFIMHCADDEPVPIENSLRYVDALKRHEIPRYTHFFEQGGHGFGMENNHAPGEWFPAMLRWLNTNKT